MAKPVTVRALKSFDYEGHSYACGADVTMTPIDAAVHARKGNVTLSKGYRTRAITPEPPAPEPDPPARTRRYRRRDMTAEDPHAG